MDISRGHGVEWNCAARRGYNPRLYANATPPPTPFAPYNPPLPSPSPRSSLAFPFHHQREKSNPIFSRLSSLFDKLFFSFNARGRSNICTRVLRPFEVRKCQIGLKFRFVDFVTGGKGKGKRLVIISSLIRLDSILLYTGCFVTCGADCTSENNEKKSYKYMSYLSDEIQWIL